MASPSSVIGRGYGSFGSAKLVITRGYGIGSASNVLVGQWSNVMLLESNQQTITLGSNQDTYRVELR